MKKNKKLSKLQQPKKEKIHIGIDEDILGYFRNGGAGYQLRINAALRLFMEANPRG